MKPPRGVLIHFPSAHTWVIPSSVSFDIFSFAWLFYCVVLDVSFRCIHLLLFNDVFLLGCFIFHLWFPLCLVVVCSFISLGFVYPLLSDFIVFLGASVFCSCLCFDCFPLFVYTFSSFAILLYLRFCCVSLFCAISLCFIWFLFRLFLLVFYYVLFVSLLVYSCP